MERMDIVEGLLAIVLSQEKEIERLERKIKHIEQYIETYEEYIKKGDY